MNTVYSGGTFDLIHVGHLELLRACRDIAGPDGRVVVAVNRDAFVERYKGRKPVQPYEQRAEMVAAIADVDLVACNYGDEDSTLALNVIRPSVIVIGDDWRDKDYLGQLGIDETWLRSRGVMVHYVPRTRGVSSSAIRMSQTDFDTIRHLADPRTEKDADGRYVR